MYPFRDPKSFSNTGSATVHTKPPDSQKLTGLFVPAFIPIEVDAYIYYYWSTLLIVLLCKMQVDSTVPVVSIPYSRFDRADV